MQVVCSFCHARVDKPVGEGAESDHGHEHLVCPHCKAEAGIEPIKSTPKPMELFGAVLAAAGFLVLVVSGLVVAAG